MTKQRKLTGWHVLGIFGGAFSVIIGVNIALAVSAVKTFPGLEVKNSYVASQTFNDRKTAQDALGWDVRAAHEGGILRLLIEDEAGKPVRVAKLSATVGRATHVGEDFVPEFRFRNGAYEAPAELRKGNWNIRMEAISGDGVTFQQRVVLHKG